MSNITIIHHFDVLTIIVPQSSIFRLVSVSELFSWCKLGNSLLLVSILLNWTVEGRGGSLSGLITKCDYWMWREERQTSLGSNWFWSTGFKEKRPQTSCWENRDVLHMSVLLLLLEGGCVSFVFSNSYTVCLKYIVFLWLWRIEIPHRLRLCCCLLTFPDLLKLL